MTHVSQSRCSFVCLVGLIHRLVRTDVSVCLCFTSGTMKGDENLFVTARKPFIENMPARLMFL